MLIKVRQAFAILHLATLLICGCERQQPTSPLARVDTVQKVDTVTKAELSPDQNHQVQAFMDQVVRAFKVADAVALADLEHPGGDPRGRANSIEFNMSLMDGGDKVKSWSARPYSDPDWEIMKHKRFHPPPTIWIDVIVNNGKRDYELAFACAPESNGALRTCFYVDR